MPPHGLQVKPFFKGFASLNLPPRYTRLEPRSLLMLCRCEASDQSKIFVLHIGVVTRAGQNCMWKLEGPVMELSHFDLKSHSGSTT